MKNVEKPALAQRYITIKTQKRSTIVWHFNFNQIISLNLRIIKRQIRDLSLNFPRLNKNFFPNIHRMSFNQDNT
ncbi:MAG: hypothetical protein B0D91_08765 [Oceanospirillales bacterium LUC14_002_19_P2]|nr:MAG: hypothetical protein B0D91_08765 [Oceanospirillales bacterium LUC14_002_19_P2]